MADPTDRTAKSNCCELKNVCGRSLWYGVVIVGVISLVVSVPVLLTSMVVVVRMSCMNVPFYSLPVLAVDLIFGLVTICVTIYQMIISALLLYQTTKAKGNIFLCSVWYVSHLSILTVYCIFFCARAIVCFKGRRYFSGAVTVIMGLIYEGTYIYFAMIVNSYLHSLNQERYF